MKFYRDNAISSKFWRKINEEKLTAIYSFHRAVWFFKNGLKHNVKNFAHINFFNNSAYKEFCLDGILHGINETFDKKTWQKYYKLIIFI